VLEHALTEASDAQERGWVEHELAHRRARRALARAIDAGRSGPRNEVRSHAKEAWRGGDRKTRAIAAGLLVAPRAAARVRAAVSRRRWAP
jgi:hypothetical protein